MDATAARTTANYQFVRHIEQPSDFIGQQYAASFFFTPSGNTNGVYLGFRANGTCVNLQRIQVYQRVKHEEIVSLVTYPETPLPRQGSNEPVTKMATCAANSENITSLQVKYFANGSREGNATCACIAGYEYVAGTGGSAQCNGESNNEEVSRKDITQNMQITDSYQYLVFEEPRGKVDQFKLKIEIASLISTLSHKTMKLQKVNSG